MKNAKNEFLEIIKGKEIICAKIGDGREDYGMKIKWYELEENYSKKQFLNFCNKLDFEYDNGYGLQELYGTILLKDSYITRYEYDGCESWQEHKMPTVKEVLGFNYKKNL